MRSKVQSHGMESTPGDLILALYTSFKTGSTQISRPTVQKILEKTGINRRKARKKPFISKV